MPMDGIENPWKPYVDLKTLDEDIAAGRLVKTEIEGKVVDEVCETCGSPVQYQNYPISGHKGWWMFIGQHYMGKAYVPHTARDCAAIKARGEQGRRDIVDGYTRRASPWAEGVIKEDDDE